MTRRRGLRDVALTVGPLAVLYALVYLPLGAADREQESALTRLVDVARGRGLGKLDADLADVVTEGYYEGLLDESRANPSTWRALTELMRIPTVPTPPDWLRLHETDAVQHDDAYRVFRLRPDVRVEYKGALLVTNRWGLRDDDCTREKPDGVTRVALVGASVAMGSGVPHEATYEALLERALNENLAGGSRQRIEILNFSVAGYRLTQQLDVLAEDVPAFDVDVILLVLNDLAVNPFWSKHLVRLIRDGRDLKYDFLRDVVRRADVRAGDRPSWIADRLAPYRDEVAVACLRRVHALVDEMEAKLIVLLTPQPIPPGRLRERLRLFDDTVAALGIPVIDLLDTFHGDLEQYWLRPWDRHPNEAGHRLLFERLYGKLYAIPRARELLELDAGGSGSP